MDGSAVFTTLLWLGLGCVFYLCAASGRIPLQCSRLELSAVALIVCVVLSTYLNLDEADGRNSLNAMWVWISFPVIFLLVANLFSHPATRRTLVLVMLAVAATIAIDGVYESLVEMPQRRLDYFGGDQAARDQMLNEAGIDAPIGSPIRYHFESRLQDTEPLVTFALTNSLAGFIACWFVVGLAILANAFQMFRSTKSNEAVSSDVLTFLVCSTICVGALLVCLVLTESRSAWGAVGIVLLLISWKLLKRFPEKRRHVLFGLAGLLSVAVLVGVISGRLDWKVVTGSTQSLAFRVEYWKASGSLAADSPIVGVGPGNFQDRYTRYKPPQGSETIADPHNWILQVLTSFGMLGLLAMVGFLVLAFRRKHAGHQASNEVGSGTILCGAIIGIALVHAISFVSDIAINAATLDRVTMIGLIVLVLMYMTGVKWLNVGEMPRGAVRLSCIGLLINLVFAGGISIPGVACSLWVLLALLGHEENDGTSIESIGLSQPRWPAVLAGVCSIGLLAAFLLTCFLPVRNVDRAMLELQNSLSGQGNVSRQLQEVSNLDVLDPTASLMLVDHLYQQLSESSSSEFSVTRYDKELFDAIESATSRAPNSHQLFGRLAEYCLALHFTTRRQSTIWLDKARELLEHEYTLYPVNAYTVARLGWVLSQIDLQNGNENHSERIQTLISTALDLDQQMPHLEYRLRNREILEFLVNRNRLGSLLDSDLEPKKSPKNLEQRLYQLRKE